MLTVRIRPFPLGSPLQRDGDAQDGLGALILRAGSLSLLQATTYKPGPTVTKQVDNNRNQKWEGVLCLT